MQELAVRARAPSCGHLHLCRRHIPPRLRPPSPSLSLVPSLRPTDLRTHMSVSWRSRDPVVRLRPHQTSSMSQSQPTGFSSHRGYEDAIAALNSLQSNAAYIKSVKHEPLATQEDRFMFAKKCAEKIGLGPKEVSNLSVIHVAGTKGKGSTSAFCESILRHNGFRTGLFSSPHLVSVTERIRIDGQPLSTQKFSQYFWYIFDAFQKREEQVDVAIVEVGIGGERDTTNILENTSVVGITSLGIDHTPLLGNSIASIAWHKAGIFKPSAVGFTVQGQLPEALEVLKKRSVERMCPVEIAPALEKYIWPDVESRQAALSFVRTQQLNVSLALQLTNAWMKRNSKLMPDHTSVPSSLSFKHAAPFKITRSTADGLLKCRWPGRNQVLQLKQTKYFLDGAHTVESMVACVEWYKSNRPSSPAVRHALLLNMTGDRDRLQVIEPLFSCKFDRVFFSPNISKSAVSGDILNLQLSQNSQLQQTQTLHDLWTSKCSKDEQNGNINGVRPVLANTVLTTCVDEALSRVEGEGGEWSILVTGSLHLVGAVLSVIDPSLEKSVN